MDTNHAKDGMVKRKAKPLAAGYVPEGEEESQK